MSPNLAIVLPAGKGTRMKSDLPKVLLARGKEVRALSVLQPCEAPGINTLEELAAVEAAMTNDQ